MAFNKYIPRIFNVLASIIAISVVWVSNAYSQDYSQYYNGNGYSNSQSFNSGPNFGTSYPNTTYPANNPYANSQPNYVPQPALAPPSNNSYPANNPYANSQSNYVPQPALAPPSNNSYPANYYQTPPTDYTKIPNGAYPIGKQNNMPKPIANMYLKPSKSLSPKYQSDDAIVLKALGNFNTLPQGINPATLKLERNKIPYFVDPVSLEIVPKKLPHGFTSMPLNSYKMAVNEISKFKSPKEFYAQRNGMSGWIGQCKSLSQMPTTDESIIDNLVQEWNNLTPSSQVNKFVPDAVMSFAR